MCLQKKADFKLHKEGKYYIGWKRFVERDEGTTLYSSISGNPNKPYPTNEWLDEKDYRENGFFPSIMGWLLYGRGLKWYRKGFHIYMEKEHGTRKVYFKKVVAKGKSLFGNKVVVAKKMMIPASMEGRIMSYYLNSCRAIVSSITENFPYAKAKEATGIIESEQLPSHLLWMTLQMSNWDVTNLKYSAKAGRWIGWMFHSIEELGIWTNDDSRKLVRQDMEEGYDLPYTIEKRSKP